jgi:peptide/nickel transport system permease protein
LGENRLAVFGLVLLLVLVGLALAAPVLPLADPNATDLARRMLPVGSESHFLGTDQLGRDLLSRLAWGMRTSLAVGLLAVLAAAVAGTLIGLAAGWFRGWLDTLSMRGIDVLLAFPYLLLALTIVAALGPGLRNAMIAIAVANIPFFARTVRGAVLELAEREFIAAAVLGGAGHVRILLRELLPNVLPVVVVMIATNLGWMILETAGLSFLGLGAQPPTADLGSMLGTSREFLTTEPRVAILPGLVILMLVVGINLVGDGLRDLLDPRLKGGGRGRAVRDPLFRTLPNGESSAHVKGLGRREWRDGGDDPDSAAMLQVDGLRTYFYRDGEVYRALDGLSFDLAPGERLAIIGESGSGKTITALSLMGLVPRPGLVVGGEVRFERRDLRGLPEEKLQALRGGRIAYIPQDPMTALNPVLGIGSQLVETLRTHQDLSRATGRRRALELLNYVKIRDASRRFGSYPHELSGGQRQRVLIAMALANDPAMIIADEATTALDVTVQAEILKLLDACCRERAAALILISHDLGVVRNLCDRALVLYAGRLVEQGSVRTLLERPLHPYTRALIACAPELGRPEKAMTPIPGQPPPLNDLPAGCHFAPRCAHARDACRGGDVPLRRLGGERAVRCLLAEELGA